MKHEMDANKTLAAFATKSLNFLAQAEICALKHHKVTFAALLRDTRLV